MSETRPPPALPVIEQAEIIALTQQWATETRSGQGDFLGLEASCGMGKTWLAREVIDGLNQTGGTGIYLPCRGGLLRPYDAVSLLVRRLLDIFPYADLNAQQEAVKQKLAQYRLGELTGDVLRLLGLPSGDSPGGADVDLLDHDPASTFVLSGDFALPDIVIRILESYCGHEHGLLPLAIAFDDIDQAGTLTPQVCVDLLKRITEIPVFVLATFLPGMPDRRLTVFSGKTARIAPLNRESLTAMVRGILRPRLPSDGLIDLLWQATGANPLHIRMALQYLMSQDMLRHDEADRVALMTEAVLPGLHEIIESELGKLTGTHCQVLQIAAILGDGFRMGAMRALLADGGPVFEDELFESLSALVDGGWLCSYQRGRRTTYHFANRAVYDGVYRMILPEQKKALHRLAGDYYAVPGTGRRVRTDIALGHYRKSGDLNQALDVIWMELREAQSAGNRARMAELFRLGASIAALDPDLSLHRARMAEGLGDMYAAAGDFSAAASAYRDLAPADMPPMLRGKLGLALLGVSPGRAQAVLQGVSESCSPETHPDLHWRAIAGQCWALALSGDTYRGLRVCRDSLAAMRHTSGLGESRTLLRAVLGMILYYAAESDEEQQEAHTHLESARAGWGARGDEAGIVLMNQVLIGTDKERITAAWLQYLLGPLLTRH
nr:hypothetical protein [Anaerolineae bacterium]